MASNNKNESYTIKNGLCVVINIKYFVGYEKSTRIDSETSVHKIKEAFEFLNCKVKVHEELDYHFTDEEVRNVINESIKSKEFNECDGFVLYIHTHGFENSFLTSNRQLILRNEIIDMFKTEHIMNLNDNWAKRDLFCKMAKIIFFDCCRALDSKDYDKLKEDLSRKIDNLKEELENESESSKNKRNIDITNLIVYNSTQQGYGSDRRRLSSALNEIIKKIDYKKDFYELMNEVNQKMQEGFTKQAIERTDINFIFNKVYFYDKKTQFIDRFVNGFCNEPNYLKELLEKKAIIFQEQEEKMSLKELIGIDPDEKLKELSSIIDRETLTKLIKDIKDEGIIIGSKPMELSDLEAAYTKLYIDVELDALGDLLQEPDNLFVISNIKKEKFIEQLSKYEDKDEAKEKIENRMDHSNFHDKIIDGKRIIL